MKNHFQVGILLFDIEKTVFDVCSAFAFSASQKADIDSVKAADSEARKKAEELLRKYTL